MRNVWSTSLHSKKHPRCPVGFYCFQYPSNHLLKWTESLNLYSIPFCWFRQERIPEIDCNSLPSSATTIVSSWFPQISQLNTPWELPSRFKVTGKVNITGALIVEGTPYTRAFVGWFVAEIEQSTINILYDESTYIYIWHVLLHNTQTSICNMLKKHMISI